MPLKLLHATRADKAGKGGSSTRQSGDPQGACVVLLLLLFLTFGALVANSKKLLYTVANPARGLLNRGKKKKKKVCQRPSSRARCSFGEKIKK